MTRRNIGHDVGLSLSLKHALGFQTVKLFFCVKNRQKTRKFQKQNEHFCNNTLSLSERKTKKKKDKEKQKQNLVKQSFC